MRQPLYNFINESANEDGIKVLVTAGIHGSEITGIIIAFRIIKDLEGGYLFDEKFDTYKNIREITIVPVINNNGMRDNNMLDTTGNYHTNLNRNWFGQFSLNTLSELVDSHDIIIDIHNSYNCTDTFLIDYSQKYKEQIVDDCITCNFNYAVYDNPFTFKHYCDTVKNKYAVTFECKGINSVNEDWTTSYNELKRFFNYLDEGLINYKFIPEYEPNHSEINYRLAISIINSGEGIFSSIPCKCQLGKVFDPNEVLGFMYDIDNYKSDIKEQIVGPNCTFRLISSAPPERYYKPSNVSILCQPVSYWNEKEV